MARLPTLIVTMVAAVTLTACSGGSQSADGSAAGGCVSVALTGTAALNALSMNIPRAKTQDDQDREDDAVKAYNAAVAQSNGQCLDLEHAYTQVTDVRARIVISGSRDKYRTEYEAARSTWDRLASGLGDLPVGGGDAICAAVATTGTAALDAKEENDVAEKAATKALRDFSNRTGSEATYTAAKQTWDAAREKVKQAVSAHNAAVLQANGGCAELEGLYQDVLAARDRIFMAWDPDAPEPKAQYASARAAWDAASAEAGG